MTIPAALRKQQLLTLICGSKGPRLASAAREYATFCRQEKAMRFDTLHPVFADTLRAFTTAPRTSNPDLYPDDAQIAEFCAAFPLEEVADAQGTTAQMDAGEACVDCAVVFSATETTYPLRHGRPNTAAGTDHRARCGPCARRAHVAAARSAAA